MHSGLRHLRSRAAGPGPQQRRCGEERYVVWPRSADSFSDSSIRPTEHAPSIFYSENFSVEERAVERRG
jgi:hypothetical protein